MKHKTVIQMEIDGRIRATSTLKAQFSPAAFGRMKQALGLVHQNDWNGSGSGAGYYFSNRKDDCFIRLAYRSYPGDDIVFTREFFQPDYLEKVSQLEQIAEEN